MRMFKKSYYYISEALSKLEKKINSSNKRLETLKTRKIYFKNSYNNGSLSLLKFNQSADTVQNKLEEEEDLNSKLINLKKDFLLRKDNGERKILRSELKIK